MRRNSKSILPSFCRLPFSRLSIAFIAAGAFAMAAVNDADHMPGNGNEHWVGTWGAALHEPDLGIPGLANTGFNNQTLRQIVHISVGGHRVRVKLSAFGRSEEHTSELQSRQYLVCRLLLEKKK